MSPSVHTQGSGQPQGTEQPQFTGLAIGVAAALLVALLAAINSVTYEIGFFHPTADYGLANIACSLLFGAGAVAGWRARELHTAQKLTWALLVAAGLILAVESLAAVHDRLERIGSLEDVLFVGYPIAGLVVLALMAGPVRRLPRPVRIYILASLTVLIASQVAGGLISLYPDMWTPAFNLLMISAEAGEVLAGGLYFAAMLAGYGRAPARQ